MIITKKVKELKFNKKEFQVNITQISINHLGEEDW